MLVFLGHSDWACQLELSREKLASRVETPMENTSIHENEKQRRSPQHQLPSPSRAIPTINPAEEQVNASPEELVILHEGRVGEAVRYEYIPSKPEPWLCGQPLTPESQATQDASDRQMEALIERSIAREEERRRLFEEEQAKKKAAKDTRRGRRFSFARPRIKLQSSRKNRSSTIENEHARLASSKSTPASPRSVRSEPPRHGGPRSMFTSLLGAPADQGISPGIFSKRSRCSSGSSNAGEGDTSSKNRSVSFIPFLKRPQSDLGCNTSYRGAPPSSMSTAGGFEASFLSYPNLVDVLSNTTTEPFDLKSFLDFTEGHWMDENVLFFLEVKAFKMAGGGEATYLTYIKRMHDIYIAPGSLREINISGEVHEATTTAVRSLLKEAAVPIMEHSSSGDPADSDSPSRGVSEPENNNDGIQEIVHPGVSSQPKPSGEPGVKQNEPLGACLQEDEQQQVTPMALQHLQLENEDQSVYSDIDGRDELGASRRRSCSHVGTDEVRLSTSNTRANAQVISDAWNTAEVEKLVELGDGGGFGDRSIFDRASQDIFQVLQMDAYPKFVAHCLRRSLALS